MNEKIAIAFDEKSREILNNIYPELRNAAVNIAVKMLAKDPMYKKYFCINCETEDDDTVELEQLDKQQTTTTKTQPAAAPQNNVVSWDEF